MKLTIKNLKCCDVIKNTDGSISIWISFKNEPVAIGTVYGHCGYVSAMNHNVQEVAIAFLKRKYPKYNWTDKIS